VLVFRASRCCSCQVAPYQPDWPTPAALGKFYFSPFTAIFGICQGLVERADKRRRGTRPRLHPVIHAQPEKTSPEAIFTELPQSALGSLVKELEGFGGNLKKRIKDYYPAFAACSLWRKCSPTAIVGWPGSGGQDGMDFQSQDLSRYAEKRINYSLQYGRSAPDR
jgi:hypothetical protein